MKGCVPSLARTGASLSVNPSLSALVLYPKHQPRCNAQSTYASHLHGGFFCKGILHLIHDTVAFVYLYIPCSTPHLVLNMTC